LERKRILIIFITLLTLNTFTTLVNYETALGAPMDVEEKWTHVTGGIVRSSPAVADLNRDGSLEVLVGSNDEYLYCINHEGGLIWSYNLTYEIDSSPIVADLDSDGSLEVLIGSTDRHIYCISHTGILEWAYETENRIASSSPAVADLGGDGLLEVLIGSSDGYVYCINNTGGLEWRYQTDSYVYSSPAVADLDNDGSLEVLIGSMDSYLYCISHTGSLVWRYLTGDGVFSSPAVADLDNDGLLDVIVGSYDGSLYCLSSSGDLKWEYDAGYMITSSPAIVDLDNDGLLEVLIGSMDSNLYCISHTGDLKWESDLDRSVYSSPAVADLDNDGSLEVLIGSMDSNLYCISHTGILEWTYTTLDQVWSSPVIADLDNDGLLDVLVGSNDYALHCITITDVSSSGSQSWWCFGGSPSRNGRIDSDGDYLDDLTELHYSTDPLNNDSDGDGLKDGWEVYYYNSNPLEEDGDFDGLTDWDEILVYNTNPFEEDTDFDGMPDGWEVEVGLNVLVNDAADDFDNDSLPNYWEYLMGLDPALDDSAMDKDGDGLTNLWEYQNGLLANNPDCDFDGMPDGWEVANGLNATLDDANLDADSDGLPNNIEFLCGLNPSNSLDALGDLDGDGLSNIDEYLLGTDLLDADTDGDGFSDGEEVDFGSNPMDASSNKTITLLQNGLIVLLSLCILFSLGFLVYKKSFKPWKHNIEHKIMNLFSELDISSKDMRSLVEEFSSIHASLKDPSNLSDTLIGTFHGVESRFKASLLIVDPIISEITSFSKKSYLNLKFITLKLTLDQDNKFEIANQQRKKAIDFKTSIYEEIVKINNENKRIEAEKHLSELRPLIVSQTDELISFLKEVETFTSKMNTIFDDKGTIDHLTGEIKEFEAKFDAISITNDHSLEIKEKLSSELNSLDSTYLSLDKQLQIVSSRVLVLTAKQEIVTQTDELSSLLEEIILFVTTLEFISKENKTIDHLEKQAKSFQVEFDKLIITQNYSLEIKDELSSELKLLDRTYSSLKEQLHIVSGRFSFLTVKQAIASQTDEMDTLLSEIIIVKTDLETQIAEDSDFYHLMGEFELLQERFMSINLMVNLPIEIQKNLASEVKALERVYNSLEEEVTNLVKRFSDLDIKQEELTVEPIEELSGMMNCPVCEKLIPEYSSLCPSCGSKLTSEKLPSEKSLSISSSNLCSSCGKDISSCKSFCRSCGSKILPKKKPSVNKAKSCANCGEDISTSKNFCKHCGGKLDAVKSPYTDSITPKSKTSPNSALDLLVSQSKSKPSRSRDQPSTSRQATSVMVKCSACSEEISQDLTFCNHCGSRQE